VRRAVLFGAHATASRGGRSLPPADHAVPQLPGLLHRGAMSSVLERSLRSGAGIDDVRVTLVDYQPGSGARVAYDVAIDGTRHVAVATAGHALCPEAVRTDARRAIARTLGRHSPVARPLTYDVGLGALVQWFPLDLSMPVLARPVPEVLRLVARAGIAIGSGAAATTTLVYRPGQRAVIRAGDVVLKAYAEDAAFRAGVAGLRIAAGLGLGAGPCLHGALPELRLTVQSALEGTPVPRARAREVAPVAGAMLAVLHDANVPGLPLAGSDRTLASAARAARLTAAVAPGLARRTLDLLARLEEHAPDMDELVPSHGDFNISQLLDVDGAMAVLDFDEACLAPRALDVTSYAANLVSGRPGDLARADGALASLLDGYGAPPHALHWYLAAALLRRSPSPFRLHKRWWLQRTESIVASAEAVLGR
jgi:aminoglycoside phosphotransferase (APT) family kinase protein